MKDITSLKFYKIIEEKLLDFGFLKLDNKWKLTKKILDGEFLLEIAIEDGVIDSKVIEIATNDRFVLYDIDNHNGAFVAQMRAEYEKLVADLIDKCAEKEVFKSEQAKQIINYINSKFDDELEFLWEKFPDYAIFRNKINKKWYCLLAGVDKSKIFGEGEGKVEIINLNLPPEKVAGLVDNKNIFQAYHMNKKSWITIPLTGLVPTKEILSLIDDSYNLSIRKK